MSTNSALSNIVGKAYEYTFHKVKSKRDRVFLIVIATIKHFKALLEIKHILN